MEQRLKQRLVGASVLVVLVVIVVPELFDNDVQPELAPDAPVVASEPGFSSSIVPMDDEDVVAELGEEPEMMAIAQAHDDDATESDDDLLETSQSGATIEDESAVTTTASEAPVPRSKPAQVGTVLKAGLTAWVVQLASFSESSRAASLRDELVEQGYAAFIQTAANDTGTFSRVLIGPELQRDEADRLRDRLLEKTKLKGQVVRFPG